MSDGEPHPTGDLLRCGVVGRHRPDGLDGFGPHDAEVGQKRHLLHLLVVPVPVFAEPVERIAHRNPLLSFGAVAVGRPQDGEGGAGEDEGNERLKVQHHRLQQDIRESFDLFDPGRIVRVHSIEQPDQQGHRPAIGPLADRHQQVIPLCVLVRAEGGGKRPALQIRPPSEKHVVFQPDGRQQVADPYRIDAVLVLQRPGIPNLRAVGEEFVRRAFPEQLADIGREVIDPVAVVECEEEVELTGCGQEVVEKAFPRMGRDTDMLQPGDVPEKGDPQVAHRERSRPEEAEQLD